MLDNSKNHGDGISIDSIGDVTNTIFNIYNVLNMLILISVSVMMLSSSIEAVI
jgi:hypothetical protein